MKITVLGCGNAFSKKNFNQQFMVEEDGRRMLIDCGRTTPEALDNAGVKSSDIDDIYISHLHGDHVGALEHIAFERYDWMTKPQKYTESVGWMANQANGQGKNHNYAPRLIGNVKLLEEVWDKTLRGGLESMEGFDATLKTFFEPVAIRSNELYRWQNWNMQLIQQVHIMTGSMISSTFGVLFSRENHKSVYFTTDSQHCSPNQMETFYGKADIVFQDTELLGVDTANRVGKFMSGVHANFAQLAGWESANSRKLSSDIKKKMWLSHYQDFVNNKKDFFGNPCDWDEFSIEEGFAGMVKVGQVFEI
jgi:ribonuclease BN (tRNA processing enzyme)